MKEEPERGEKLPTGGRRQKRIMPARKNGAEKIEEKKSTEESNMTGERAAMTGEKNGWSIDEKNYGGIIL